jgi:hypothetical protein
MASRRWRSRARREQARHTASDDDDDGHTRAAVALDSRQRWWRSHTDCGQGHGPKPEEDLGALSR